MSLFNNPEIERVKSQLSPEVVEEYKKMGEYLYNNEAFQTVHMSNQIHAPATEELVAYADCALRSGLQPYELSQEELRLLGEVYGKTWYKRYGFTEKDLAKPKKPDEPVHIETKEEIQAKLKKRIKEEKNKRNKH
jgi:hypothetical protein